MTRAILPPRVRRVFVDSSAYYAVTDARDRNHELALAISEQLVRARVQVFTTNFILAETHALILARRDRVTSANVLAEIDDSTTIIVRVSASDERRPREIIRQYDDKDFSLTDVMSFVVMQRLRIPVAFTFDRDFAQYGFQVLQT